MPVKQEEVDCAGSAAGKAKESEAPYSEAASASSEDSGKASACKES